ncbi:type II secretion system F family protein [bacterium]|nr:type II secretion system F family protein [bacterium]
MLSFCYRAVSSAGIIVAGNIEGASHRSVKKGLIKKNYQILSLYPNIVKSLSLLFKRRQLSRSALIDFFGELGKCLNMGMDLLASLKMMRETTVDSMVKRVCVLVDESIRNGFTLADALGRTNVIPKISIAAVRVGEKSGDLSKSLRDLAETYKVEQEFVSELKRAATYPLVVISFLFIVVIFVGFYVIPKLEPLFAISGGGNFMTKGLLFLSFVLRKFWWLIIISFFGLCYFIGVLKERFSQQFYEIIYKIKLVGVMAKETAISRAFHNLGLLAEAGIPVLDSLSIVVESMPYKYICAKLNKVRERLLMGGSFGEVLNDGFFPPQVYDVIARGEKRGALGESFLSVAEYYRGKVRDKLIILTKLVEPVMIIIAALLVVGVLFSFFVPIYSNVTNIENISTLK